MPQFPLAVHHLPTSALQPGGVWERTTVHPQKAASIFRERACGLQMRHEADGQQKAVECLEFRMILELINNSGLLHMKIPLLFFPPKQKLVAVETTALCSHSPGLLSILHRQVEVTAQIPEKQPVHKLPSQNSKGTNEIKREGLRV